MPILFYITACTWKENCKKFLRKWRVKNRSFAISSLISNDELIYHDSSPDPHIWFDITLWQKAGERVLEILIAEDPSHQADYQHNALAYLSQLQQLHEWVLNEVQRFQNRNAF